MNTNPHISREAVAHRAAKHGIPVDTVVELLESIGIPVEDPKPEPGIYLTTLPGDALVLVSEGDTWQVIEPDTGAVTDMPRLDPRYLTPARVVPADEWQELNIKAEEQAKAIRDLRASRVVPGEPVELTEDDVLNLFAIHAKSGWGISALSPTLVHSITATVNAALAKYGHGN